MKPSARTAKPVSLPTARKRLLSAAQRLLELADVPFDDKAADDLVEARTSKSWLRRLEQLIEKAGAAQKKPGRKPDPLVAERRLRFHARLTKARAARAKDPTAPNVTTVADQVAGLETTPDQAFEPSDVFAAESAINAERFVKAVLRGVQKGLAAKDRARRTRKR